MHLAHTKTGMSDLLRHKKAPVSSWQVSRARSGLGMMDMPLILSRTFSLKVWGGVSCSSSGSALTSAVSRGLCWLEKEASLCCAEILQH